MRIVIVGASGNLGTALLRRLACQGADEIVGVARRIPPPLPPYHAARWHSVDVAELDAADRLTPVFDRADAVVNLAWGFQPGRDVQRLQAVGIGGSAAVLRAVRAAGVPHLVQLSSVGAYGPGAYRQRRDETWPTSGIPTSAYSRHKSKMEALLDEDAAVGGGPVVTRFRPALVMNREAGSELLRNTVPGFVPAAALRWLPVLPVDRRLVLQVVHVDDVASAIVTALRQRTGGAFNLAAEPPLSRDALARALGARPVHLPSSVLRAVLAVGWWLRLQKVEPGWLDMGFSVPLMDCSRAERELGWRPSVTAPDALRDTLAGMAAAVSTPSPALRRRTVAGALGDVLRGGPITTRPVS
jgi:nucleoside-diphosphate-sugar epimerase